MLSKIRHGQYLTYVAIALIKLVPTMETHGATGGTFKEISKSKFLWELGSPPPLEVQKEIVAEIEGYQKVIDGAGAILDNYRPHVPIDPDWPLFLRFEGAPFTRRRPWHFLPEEGDFRPRVTVSSSTRLSFRTVSTFQIMEFILKEKDQSLRKRTPPSR